MRYHHRGRAYWLNHEPALARRIIAPAHLAIARLEPAISPRYEATLDLVFERDGAFAVLPFIIVDGFFLVEREYSPFAWPAMVRDLMDEPALLELERTLEPWLQSRLLARCENDIVTRFFRDEPAVRAAFAQAQVLGLYGAAPLPDVLRTAAPYVYAYRFASDACVAVTAEDGGNGAALLYGRAREVSLAANEANAFARSWFSTQPLHEETPADVVVTGADGSDLNASIVIRVHNEDARMRTVPVAQSLPFATFVTFDPDDSVIEDRFTVEARSAHAFERSKLNAEPSPVGGSAGRIALLVREDWSRAEDADGDAIRVLQRRLSGEGFSVRIVEGWSHLEAEDVDLVHVIGTQHASVIRPKLERLHAAGVPIVTMPYLDDPRGEGLWGASLALFAFRNSTEDTFLNLYLNALAVRRLGVDGVPAHHTLPLPPDPDVAKLFELSGAVLVSTPEEEALLRERFGYRGPTPLVPALVDSAVPVDVQTIAGTGDFILMHGPIDARSNVLYAVMAAEAERLPLVITGPVASGEVINLIYAYTGDYVRYVPASQLSPEEIEGLYARARVFADISWNGRGLSRLARAGGYGASIVVAAASHAAGIWGELATVADAGSIDSIRQAFRTAWEAHPGRKRAVSAVTAEICNPVLALSGTVLAYQLASQPQPAPAR